MGDGDDSGRHIPGEPHEGAQGHEDAHPEQVQMVASSLLHGAVGGEKLSRESAPDHLLVWGKGDRNLPRAAILWNMVKRLPSAFIRYS